MTALQSILNLVEDEFNRATKLHGSMNSFHEAKAIIEEEFEEFWDEVKKKQPNVFKVRKELTQVATMAVRAIYDLT